MTTTFTPQPHSTWSFNPSLSQEVTNYWLIQVFVIIFKSKRTTTKLRDLKIMSRRIYLESFQKIFAHLN